MNKKLKNQSNKVKKVLNMKAVAVLLTCGVLVGASTVSMVNVYKWSAEKDKIYNKFQKENLAFNNYIDYKQQQYTKMLENKEISPENYAISVSKLVDDKNVMDAFDKYATQKEEDDLNKANACAIGSFVNMLVTPYIAMKICDHAEGKVGNLFIEKKQDEDEKECL